MSNSSYILYKYIIFRHLIHLNVFFGVQKINGNQNKALEYKLKIISFISEPPNILSNCSINNETNAVVVVTCMSQPTDMPTKFLMEVSNNATVFAGIFSGASLANEI